VSDNLSVNFHDEREFRDKVWIVPVMVEDKMLHAAGTVNVPECFSGEIFDDFKVARLFRADIVFFHCLSPKFLCESAQIPWKTALKTFVFQGAKQ
jgi:hypothetical protein